ncbi:DUF302 domain-containing protein [Haloflavibacter putidus]|uniref:DUF302 domain-containing protein n=1 Tax=Haloflavibacter putidus TaxID=2576776 RepID=A0A507ZRR3_9FLAO|nr:DUF302 domain-containing protein [Haloflavibacter putidus]TQD39697.1 DUF302 domain-containing protein [Haloflavibacter putidus]
MLYNSTEYLASRYGVGEVESLSKTSKALNNLVSTATKTQGKHTKKQNVGLEEGIINVKSTTDFESTYNNLKSAIEANENISVMGELDHKKNAASVGMNLRPTKVIMFGNPKLGTPIMHTKRNLGLDLPQKMLVWENAKGNVYISYNNANFLAKKHRLEMHGQKFKEISKALEMLANAAAEID